MIYLVLGVVFGTVTAVVYKGATQLRCRTFAMLSVERAVIVLFMCGLSFFVGGYAQQPQVLAVSLLGGISVLAARWLLLLAMRLGPAGITWTVVNLAVAVPVILSMVMWGEWPTLLQAAGLLTAPAAIALLRQVRRDGAGTASKSSPARLWLLVLLACFVTDGLFGTCFKLVKELDLEESRNTFVLLYNLTAFLGAAAAVIGRRIRPARAEIRMGLLSGVTIALSAVFWVKGVLALPGIVFFPLASVGGVVLTLVIMRLIWNERLDRRQQTGALLALLSMVLILVPGGGGR